MAHSANGYLIMLWIAACLLGCSRVQSTKPKKPESGDNALPGRSADPQTPVVTPQQTAKPTFTIRTLDKDASSELSKEFRENPLTARKRYETTRWRISAKVTEIDDVAIAGFGSARIEIQLTPNTISKGKPGDGPNGTFVPGIMYQTVIDLPLSDCEKLARDKTYTFEARIHEFAPHHQAVDIGVVLKNCRLVE